MLSVAGEGKTVSRAVVTDHPEARTPLDRTALGLLLITHLETGAGVMRTGVSATVSVMTATVSTAVVIGAVAIHRFVAPGVRAAIVTMEAAAIHPPLQAHLAGTNTPETTTPGDVSVLEKGGTRSTELAPWSTR